MDKETLREVEEFLERYPAELDWGYDGQFSEDQVRMLISGDRDDFMEDIWEKNPDWIWNTEHWAYRYAIEQLDLLPSDVCECKIGALISTLKDEGIYPSIDYRLDQPVRNTRAYLAAQLPIEHITYWEDYADVKDELEWLGINPADMREWFPEVRWYACPTRTTPIISARDLVDAWINCGYAGYWYVMLDAESVLRLAVRGELDGKLVVERGASLIIHDYFNGASSMNAYTLNDIEIEAKWIFDDGNNRYGIQSCCGFIGEAWSGVVSKNGE